MAAETDTRTAARHAPVCGGAWVVLGMSLCVCSAIASPSRGCCLRPQQLTSQGGRCCTARFFLPLAGFLLFLGAFPAAGPACGLGGRCGSWRAPVSDIASVFFFERNGHFPLFLWLTSGRRPPVGCLAGSNMRVRDIRACGQRVYVCVCANPCQLLWLQGTRALQCRGHGDC